MSEEINFPDASGLFDSPDKNTSQAAAAGSLREAEQSVAETWHIGDLILDTYQVQEIFTGGGMGLVYRVFHTGWNTDLIVKAPRADFFRTAKDKANFQREAETWINLGLHPHIVSCYYVRELGGIPRVFAEYLEGGSLQDWIRSGKLYEGGPEKSLERILDIAIQSAWGLDYAHEQGLVHQDVKPSNVMLTADGLVKVTDFGLAKAGGENSLAERGEGERSLLVTVGGMTPAYCSPEQANRQGVTRRTDIWSWAVSVLEMFTGEITWRSGQLAGYALQSYLKKGIQDPAIPDMPANLAELLNRCLQLDSAKRPATMLEVADLLRQIYQEEVKTSHSRKLPKVVEALADRLNNQAVSLLDLGKKEKALELWDQALKADPGHEISIYNQGLVLWRDARIDDEQLLTSLKKAVREDSFGRYLTALVHAERGDCRAALEQLDQIKFETMLPEVAELRREVQNLLPQSRRLVKSFELPTRYLTSLSRGEDGWYGLSKHKQKFKVWNLNTGQSFTNFNSESIDGWLSPNGKYVLCKNGFLWDVQNERGYINFAVLPKDSPAMPLVTGEDDLHRFLNFGHLDLEWVIFSQDDEQVLLKKKGKSSG